MKKLSHIKKFNEGKKLSSWELNSKIEEIVNSNIKEIPFEGTEVDKYGLRASILELIQELCPELKPNGRDQNSDNEGWEG